MTEVDFPHGKLPSRGYRCEACGEEWFRAEDVAQTQALARRLGLYGREKVQQRKIQTSGTSAVVTLSPELLERIHAKPGTVVEVGLEGERIVITNPKQAIDG